MTRKFWEPLKGIIKLYTCTTNTHDNDLIDFIEHLDIPKLTDEERERIEEPLTLQECKIALDTFQANKTLEKMDSPLNFVSILSDSLERT